MSIEHVIVTRLTDTEENSVGDQAYRVYVEFIDGPMKGIMISGLVGEYLAEDVEEV
jgi:hypothetical protein